MILVVKTMVEVPILIYKLITEGKKIFKHLQFVITTMIAVDAAQ